MTASPPRSERPDMAGYGVTDDLEGALAWSWAEERLLATRNFWFVTVSGAGRPHALPLWGVWMPERQRFGFSSAPTARKIRNLRANDRVVFTTDDSTECISVEGRAIALEGADRAAVAEAWADKYFDGSWPKSEMISFFDENAAHEVIPDRAFGIIETPKLFSSAATRWVWD